MDIQDILERLKIKYPKYCKDFAFLGITILIDGSGTVIHGIDDKIIIEFDSLSDLWRKLNDQPQGQ